MNRTLRLIRFDPLTAVAPLVLLGFGLTGPATVRPLSSQTVSVKLEADDGAGGLVRERFEEELGGLNGVELAADSDPAHYVVNLNVLCMPDPQRCDAAESFTVSVVLSEPLTSDQLQGGLRRTGDETLGDWEPTPQASAFLRRFRQMHAVWAASWFPTTYAAEVARLVRGMDARCFQQRRVLEARKAALIRRGETAAARDLSIETDPTGRGLC